MFIYMPAIISPLIMGYICGICCCNLAGLPFHLLDKVGKGEWYGNWLGRLRYGNVGAGAGKCVAICRHDHGHLSGISCSPYHRSFYRSGKMDGGFQAWPLFVILHYRFWTFHTDQHYNLNIIGSLSVFDVVMSPYGGWTRDTRRKH